MGHPNLTQKLNPATIKTNPYSKTNPTLTL